MECFNVKDRSKKNKCVFAEVAPSFPCCLTFHELKGNELWKQFDLKPDHVLCIVTTAAVAVLMRQTKICLASFFSPR